MRIKYFLLVVFAIYLLQCKHSDTQYILNEGKIFGTYYHIKYKNPNGKNLKATIEQKLQEFNASLSTFEPNSIISRINQNDPSVNTDTYFEDMYRMAYQVSEKTGGAFDITVAPLVNAWGFGYGKLEHTTLPNVDTILPYIGYKKISLTNHKLLKESPKTLLDASAIAKGQGVDVIAQLLDNNGCINYMVEIGGEVRCKGVNPNREKWHIGIDAPQDDPTNENRTLETIVAISNVGMATSGNYRQYYYKNGKKYAHTINPHTGMPVQHHLLSATVIAPTCMEADAFATAFMVLGTEQSIAVCKSIPQLDCYLIYADKNGQIKTRYTSGFEQYFVK